MQQLRIVAQKVQCKQMKEWLAHSYNIVRPSSFEYFWIFLGGFMLLHHFAAAELL